MVSRARRLCTGASSSALRGMVSSVCPLGPSCRAQVSRRPELSLGTRGLRETPGSRCRLTLGTHPATRTGCPLRSPAALRSCSSATRSCKDPKMILIVNDLEAISVTTKIILARPRNREPRSGAIAIARRDLTTAETRRCPFDPSPSARAARQSRAPRVRGDRSSSWHRGEHRSPGSGRALADPSSSTTEEGRHAQRAARRRALHDFDDLRVSSR